MSVVERFVVGRDAVVDEVCFSVIVKKQRWIYPVDLRQPCRVRPWTRRIFCRGDKISSDVDQRACDVEGSLRGTESQEQKFPATLPVHPD